ncbi:sulfurtransferase complex subunit TusB [Thalassomonas sp. M1454]|uniref:sulfurtransferase complex subunit TusB n=1 Tax=Thalassomonas sp. M1454 TaxID=2594477 RepID=UPI001181255A|nr:sulfurtransferase complex subunit TusB [Thalassomonas sp. M1454]TRX56888.1 sulfurtransferase complex subunit TusB [Thalassomonas sp. M1454]
MCTLHLIRTSAFADNKLQQCIALLEESDQIVLIDDGVYNVNHNLIDSVSNSISALSEHIQARGLSSNNIKQMSYTDLVKATEKAGKVITWQ